MNRLFSHIMSLYFRFPYVRHVLWTVCTTVAAAAAISLAFVTTRVSTLPVGWEKSFAVSPAGIYAKNIHVASRGSMVAMVFEGTEKDRSRIFISLSFNGGSSFLDPVAIADTDRKIDHLPRVAISPRGHVAVVWQSLVADDSNGRVFLAVSADMGATWGEPRRLFLGSDVELQPQIIYDRENRLHLFFHGHRKGMFNLFHTVSDDDRNFDKPDSLVSMGNLRGAFFPAIHAHGSEIYIVWQGKGEVFGVLSDDLYFMKSSNYGRGWTSPRKITSSRANDASPSIVLFRNVLYCVYQNNDEKNWTINMIRGFDRGKEWDLVPLKVSTTNANAYSPVIMRGKEEELVIVWYDTRDVVPGVMARKYLVPESRFSPEGKLSREKTPARHPTGITSRGRVLALWQEGPKIMAKYSDIGVDPPAVFSRTHPEARWSVLSDALVEWRAPADESGVAGYAVFVNREPFFIPTVQNLEGNVRTYRIPSLEDGITYFHIRTVDRAGNFSRPIHYKLQVSRTPLPMPVVVSPTHPEATAVNLRRSVVRWSVEQKQRLKGFVYSLAKDTIARPETFTTGFEKVFDGLENGRYFFTIAAIDRTNTPGRVATYEIIVNKADPIDRTVYDNIIKGLQKPIRITGKYRGPYVPVPLVTADLPFDAKKPYGKPSFSALLVSRNIKKGSIVGYSVVLSSEKADVPRRINFKDDIVRLARLSDGEYYLGVRAQYRVVRNGRAVTYWTRPSVTAFTIRSGAGYSRVMAYGERVTERITRYRFPISISLVCIALSILTLGFGTRISFFAKAVQFRFRNVFRSIL